MRRSSRSQTFVFEVGSRELDNLTYYREGGIQCNAIGGTSARIGGPTFAGLGSNFFLAMRASRVILGIPFETRSHAVGSSLSTMAQSRVFLLFVDMWRDARMYASSKGHQTAKRL